MRHLHRHHMLEDIRGENDVHDLRLREPEIAEPLQVGVSNRGRVVDDPLRQVHDCDIDLVEARGVMIECNLEHRLAEAFDEHRPMSEAAIARAQPPCGGKRDELVTAEIHSRLDRAVQLKPCRVDLRPIGEGALMVRGQPG